MNAPLNVHPLTVPNAPGPMRETHKQAIALRAAMRGGELGAEGWRDLWRGFGILKTRLTTRPA